MPSLEVTRSVTVTLDEVVGFDELEATALAFARTAPAELISSTVDAMVAELVTEVCGPFGLPIADEEQITAPRRYDGDFSHVAGHIFAGQRPRRRGLKSSPVTPPRGQGAVGQFQRSAHGSRSDDRWLCNFMKHRRFVFGSLASAIERGGRRCGRSGGSW